MLEINPETVCLIIARAREFHAKEGVEIPEEGPAGSGDDWALEVLEDHLGDMTYQEVRDTIEDLEPDQQVALVALMWVGRGEFGVDEWDGALEAARDAWTSHTAEYLMATPLVADFLEEGLGLMGYSCED